MEALQHAGFELAHDPERTRAAWRDVRRGAAEACGCEGCRAWCAARAEGLPAEVAALLDALGLSPALESECTPLGRGPTGGLAVRVGWAFAGELRAAPASAPPGLCFVPDPLRAPAGLADGPLAGLELELELEPPPPAAGD